MKSSLKEKYSIVECVEKEMMSLFQDTEEASAIRNVFTNITLEKIATTGKVELLLCDRNLANQKSGKTRLNLSGKEIMQLAAIVATSTDLSEKERCTYTTLYHLNMKNIEQMLIILYWFARIATSIYTQVETNIKNLSFNIEFEKSYTNHVSNTQRYKMLGNGFTVDVIVHILRHLKEFRGYFK